MIGRLHHVIVDCPDPAALAAFYSELLGLPVTWQEDDFAVVSASDTTSGIGFQLAPDFQPPRWPDPARPQQMHFDVMVDDVEAAEPRVLALGARRLPGHDSHVYADPAGHPFCLIPRPHWASPIDASIGTSPIGARQAGPPSPGPPSPGSDSPALTPPPLTPPARGASHRVCP